MPAAHSHPVRIPIPQTLKPRQIFITIVESRATFWCALHSWQITPARFTVGEPLSSPAHVAPSSHEFPIVYGEVSGVRLSPLAVSPPSGVGQDDSRYYFQSTRSPVSTPIWCRPSTVLPRPFSDLSEFRSTSQFRRRSLVVCDRSLNPAAAPR